MSYFSFHPRERSLMVRWVVGSILHGAGPIELFLVPSKGAFAHGAVGRRIDPSWVDPLSYFSFHPRERSLMVRWVVGSILHGVDPLSYFSFHPRERSLMVRWVVGSILHGVRPIELFLVPSKGAFAHGAVGRRIDPSWGGPIELFLVPSKGAFAHGAVGCRIDPSWGGPIELFLVPSKGAFAHGAVGRRIDPSWGGPIELFLVPSKGA